MSGGPPSTALGQNGHAVQIQNNRKIVPRCSTAQTSVAEVPHTLHSPKLVPLVMLDHIAPFR